MTLKSDISALIDEIPRGKGRSAAKGTDSIAREQLAAQWAVESGYGRKIVVPTHLSEFGKDTEITFHPRKIA